MEKIVGVSSTWMWMIPASILLASASVGFAKAQKKSAASGQEKPEAILAAAKKIADAKAWSVQAHVNADKDMKISGIIFGKDFDLTIETVDRTTRQIALGDKSWSSDDGGKSWKENNEIDRRFYYLMHTPIKYSTNEKIPPFAEVGTEKLGNESLLHIRFIAPDKITYEGDRANYWIALQDRQSPVIHRFLGPMGFENNYVTDQVDYTPNMDEHPILPPPGNPHAQAPPPGPEALLMAAMKKMSTGVWSVNGTVTFKNTIKLHGLLSGEDFDLTNERVKPNTPMRGIVIKDKAWVCSDGETWHAGSPDDRLLYNWAHTPIMTGRLWPPFEKVGSEQRDGQTWLHIQLKVAEAKADPNQLPQYWLVLDSQGQAQYIGHAEMPMFSQGASQVVHCSFDYAPAKEKIAPPPLGPPVDDKVHGFNDIEQHKFDWKGKIVRVEMTPKLLQSEQIGEDTYRAFLKDTAIPNHYGVVEFPHDALVKLGFLKKTVSGTHASEQLEKMGALGRTEGEPVSFYVEVIPIGERPAARAAAVGAKLVRDADGSVSYTWDTGKASSEKKQRDGATDQKNLAKSAPPASSADEEPAGDLVNRGIKKAKDGDLDGAIADFDSAIKADPKNDAPYYNRAQAKRLKKDTAGAIADYTHAIELGSTNPAAYNNRGNARSENNDPDGAIADYTRAIELKPDYARAYYNRAVTKKAKGDAKGAAADFKRAKELDPKLASEESAADSKNESDVDLVERGIEKGQQGDLDGALTDLNRAIELDPKNSAAYYNRAATKLLKKDTAGAIADYTHVIELDPKNVNAYNNRGILKARNNDPDGALADYNHAIELDPKEAKAYNNRGNVKKAKGELDGAIADFTSAIELDSNLAIAYKNRAEARQAKGDKAEAEADFKSAEKIDLVNRGIEKAKKGDLDGAIADFSHAIELDPKDAIAYSNRAHAKRLKKDAAGALADCTRAIELDPKFAEAYFERGTLKGRNKDADGAIADLTRAIELKPDYAFAYYNRGIARKAKGDKAGADADFKSAAAANRVSLLDGKLKIDISPDFSREPDDPAHPKTIAKFSGPADGAWGEVLRGTHGLTPEDLPGYLKRRVDEYSKGFKWLSKDSHLQWLKKEIVTIDGRKWADWRYVPVLKGKKDYSHNPVYTRFLTTSYKGQLLEVTFTSNLNTSPELKAEIDRIMDSAHLEE
jgi:tetratricopeptide (TPR) repeat protein